MTLSTTTGIEDGLSAYRNVGVGKGKRENEKEIMSGKTQGNLCKNTEKMGNFVCSSCIFTNFKDQGYCNIYREILNFVLGI